VADAEIIIRVDVPGESSLQQIRHVVGVDRKLALLRSSPHRVFAKALLGPEQLLHSIIERRHPPGDGRITGIFAEGVVVEKRR
jgi:hypothetical protein